MTSKGPFQPKTFYDFYIFILVEKQTEALREKKKGLMFMGGNTGKF